MQVSYKKLNELDASEWNAFVKKHGTLYHTSNYAEIQEANNLQARFVLIHKDDKLAGGLVLFKDKLLGLRLLWGFSPIGASEEAIHLLAKEYKKICRREAIFNYIRDESFEKSKLKGFYKSHSKTIIIDLENPLETIWKKVSKSSGRWGVKFAERKGVTVGFENTERAWEEFYEFHKNNCAEQKRKAKPFSFFQAIKKHLADNKMAKLISAKYQNKTIAYAIIGFFGNKINLMSHAWSHEHRNLQANNLIYWHIMKWGSENKYACLDLRGTSTNPLKAKGTDYFKKKWGGEVTNVPLLTTSLIYLFLRKFYIKFL